MVQGLHNNNNNNNQPTQILKQLNLDGIIVKSLDVERFGECFEPIQSKDFTRVLFQNCGPQLQYRTSKKAMDGSLAMSAGKYDV